MPLRSRKRPERRLHHVVGIDENVEGIVGADLSERHDGEAVAERETHEAGAVLPEQLVALALAPEDLATAARKHQHVLAARS